MRKKIFTNSVKDAIDEILSSASPVRNIVRSSRLYSNIKFLELNAALAGSATNLLLDVGANQGQFASEMRKAGYHGMMRSFEPDVNCFSVLEKKSAADGQWKAHN